MKTNVLLWSYLAKFFLELNMFQTGTENQNTYKIKILKQVLPDQIILLHLFRLSSIILRHSSKPVLLFKAVFHKLKHSLGAFDEWRKVTINIIMSVRLFVRLHGTTRLPLNWVSWKFISVYFFEGVEEIHVSLKSDMNNGYFTWRPTYIYDYISLNSS
jgi:hypothetical protein